jgi:hypothetical protein
MKLLEGQWFMYPIEEAMPDRLTVYEGPVEARIRVTTISRYQAMALKRWHGNGPVYYTYRNGFGDYRNVRVVGDIDAWGDES